MPEFRLRRLLEANRLAVEHLDLPTALRQIVEAALELVGASYGAIGVLGPNGRLAEFIHVRMDDETVASIGSPPAGLGLLGALIADPRPVRLAHLGSDARSVGCPAHHTVLNSFLGVPLEVRPGRPQVRRLQPRRPAPRRGTGRHRGRGDLARPPVRGDHASRAMDRRDEPDHP